MKNIKWIFLGVLLLALYSQATILPQRVGPVSQYGKLITGEDLNGKGRIYGSIQGVKKDAEVQLMGLSLSWSLQWPSGGAFYGSSYLKSLVEKQNPELIRAAMGAVATWGRGNYLTRPEFYLAQMDTIVQAAIQNDIYVLIDFHSEGGYWFTLHPGAEPKYEFNDSEMSFTKEQAAEFFSLMAARYGKYPHVIFEIYNEPVSETWSELKDYSETVIAAIRKYSDNLIVVGTPMWSSMAGDAVSDPLDDPNVAYTYHYYGHMHSVNNLNTGSGIAANHAKSSETAMNAGLAIMITEWGFSGITDQATRARVDDFIAWVNEHKISTAKWCILHPNSTDENNSKEVNLYMSSYVLRPLNTSYSKNWNWEAEIKDSLPIPVKIKSSGAIKGSWNVFSDASETAVPKGASTFMVNEESPYLEVNKIVLNKGTLGFPYEPYLKADVKNSTLGECRLVSYLYKGSHHQFTLTYDWTLSNGIWDFPFLEMPYSPDWTKVIVDWNLLESRGWQNLDERDSVISTKARFDYADGLRFEIVEKAFADYLWVDSLTCIKDAEGYSSIKELMANKNSLIQVKVQNQSILISNIQVGQNFAVINMLGQAIHLGRAASSSISIASPIAGRYVVRVGNESYPISISK